MLEVEIIELNMPYGGYCLRGHGHSKQDIVNAINKHEERDADTSYSIDDVEEIEETYGHWCYGWWEGESDMRYLNFDKKYKGVRGGFAITYVDILKENHR